MATARDDLEDLITCVVCFLKYQDRDPRCLPCLHVYCFTCLQNIYDTAVQKDPSAAGQIRCPTCQSVTRLKDNSLTSLPRYFHASKVQDILSRMDQIHVGDVSGTSEDVKCSICTTKDGCYYCLTCGQAMCVDCHDTHNRNKSHSDHKKLQLDQQQLKALFCGQHKILYVSYCVDCFKPVCKSCKQMTSHENHNFSQLIIDTKENINDATGSLSEVITKCKNGIEVIHRLQHDFDGNVNEVVETMAKHKQELIDKLNAEEKELTRMLKIKQMETQTKLEEVCKSLTTRQNRSEALFLYATRLAHPFAHIPNVTLQNLSDSISDLSNNVSHGFEKLCLPPKYVYISEDISGELGKIKPSPREAISANDPIWKYFNNYLQIEPTQMPPTIMANRPQLKRLWSMDMGGSAVSLGTFSNGDFLMLCRKELHTKMFHYNSLGRLLTVPVHIPDGYTALNVAICKVNDNIVILCMRGITHEVIFLSQANIVRSTPCWSPTFIKLIDEGFSIAFWNRSSILVGGITNGTIDKYNLISGKVCANSKVNHPCYSLAVCQELILVSDRSNVYVYEDDFQLRSFFDSKRSVLLRSVVSVCTDDENNVYMANTCGQIFKFSSQGKFIKTVAYQDGLTCISVRSKETLTTGMKTGVAVFALNTD